MNNRWLNDLHRKMEDHEEDVPDGLWDDIKDELFSGEDDKGIAGGLLLENDDKKEDKTIPAGKTNILLYRIGGMAAAIAMLFFTGKFLLEMNADKTGPQISKNVENADSFKQTDPEPAEQIKANTNDPVNTVPGEKYSSQENQPAGKMSIHNILDQVFGSNIKDNHGITPGSGEKESGANLLTKKESSVSIIPPVNENPALKNEQNAGEKFNNNDTFPERLAANDKPKVSAQKSRKWMLSMLTGNVSSNSSEQKFPGYASISGAPMTFSDMWISGTDPDPLTEVLLANQSKEVEARIRHKVPVTFGVSVYYNLGKRWGIGTGVNYTKLTSELHSGSNSNYIKGDQSVHYIGIPVQVNYNVIQKGRFTGYVTGGVLAEKAVAGKLKTQYIVDDEVQNTQEERLDIKPVQVSVNSAVGLQVKIIDKIGIYAEPGIGYHFKNDSQLNTIYKEKPLNFNMKFGIRLLLD
ncbi:PorT family protein [Chryseobacterium oranimense]|uniref:PorT family protein n=1 Tax=Chryseobacterium oranimense TaxID=421058 RepID=UPI0021AE89F9|nr:PorT family protein [Chryseobacterium oranimense]UWX59767.1 PorT family protein [Chryseobacterium oranimense]